MTKQQTRSNVAHFLKVHLNNVMQLEKAKPGSLIMDKIVTHAKTNGHICGTVCCMDGWLADTYPHLYELKRVGTEIYNVFIDFKLDDLGRLQFTINSVPIPEIEPILWQRLTGQILNAGINIHSSTKQVKQYWNKAIQQILSGAFDHYLNFDAVI